MKKHIIILRGVMPTGRNKVPMAQLREKLTEAGFEEVGTYIQSGNVLLITDLTEAKLEKKVHDLIEKHFGGVITVIAKTPKQFKKIIEQNPFSGTENTKRLYYMLLNGKPKPEYAEELQKTDFSPDEAELIGNVVYVRYATKVSDSKFNNNWFERKLKVSGSTRNFNTMTKLLELSNER